MVDAPSLPSSSGSGLHINALPHSTIQHAFSFLDPRSLCLAKGTCRLWRVLNSDLASDRLWEGFFVQRWKRPHGSDVANSWQDHYARKMNLMDSYFSGKYLMDALYGHSDGVRAVKLLPAHQLMVTGSKDRTVRLWDLQQGTLVGTSRPHGGLVRCLALDADMLVSGGSDTMLRAWHSVHSSGGDEDEGEQHAGQGFGHSVHSSGRGGDEDEGWQHAGQGIDSSDGGIGGGRDCDQACGLPPSSQRVAATSAPSTSSSRFDLSRPARRLRRLHTGPVSALCLSPRLLASGSWDCTVRLWDRATLQPAAALSCADWVSQVAIRGPLLHVLAGGIAYSHDLQAGGRGLGARCSLGGRHAGGERPAWTALEATFDGRCLFAGDDGGGVWSHDLRAPPAASAGGGGRLLAQLRGPISSLSLEDPWLAAGTATGCVGLVNTEHAGRGGGAAAARPPAPQRQVQYTEGGGAVYCVDLADRTLAVGGSGSVVRTWCFSHAQPRRQRRADAVDGRKAGKASSKHARCRAAAGGGAAAAVVPAAGDGPRADGARYATRYATVCQA